MCRGLVREVRAARVDPLAARLEHRGDGVLREPVDLEVGVELAQLVGDRRVALRVAEADRRGDVERALAARLAAHPARRPGRRRDEVAQEQVDLDRVAGVREMARPVENHELAVRELREPGPGFTRSHGVVAAVDHEHRAVDPGREAPRTPSSSVEARCELGRDQRLGVGLEAPADRVLARLRRVRLGEALREEELEELLVVLEPVVAVPLPPADVVVARLAELTAAARSRGTTGGSGRAGAMKTSFSTRSGWLAASVQRPFRASGERHQHGALGGGCVHHRERVGGELLLPVRVGLGRAVGAAVAATVEDEHAAVPREVRDLHLPVARVDDRPRRHEQDGRLARAVDLVVEPHAVALDVAGLVRVAAPASARARRSVSSTATGRSSRGAPHGRCRCRRGARR